VQLYESVLRAYGELPGAVIARCGGVGSDGSAFPGTCGDAVGVLSEGERVQILHGLASEVASYGARVAWGLGLRGDTTVVESPIGGSSAGSGVGEVRSVEVPGVSGSAVGRGVAAVDAGATAPVVGEVCAEDEVRISEKTLANRAKRHRKVAAKRERKARELAFGSEVPEWRRKDVRATFHKGAFADCSVEVQRELRDTRAKMLVEKNRVALVQAEQERRRLEARLQARMVEEEVEKKRLELVVENQRLQSARAALQPAGYAETLCSLGLESSVETPSLSLGSVSPSSSISVAELREREAATRALVAQVAELRLQVSKQEAQGKKKKAQPVHDPFYREGDVCLREVDERQLYSRWD